ncbi:MAG: hypothetical protein ABUL60_01695 [Myxococcales bacterium]
MASTRGRYMKDYLAAVRRLPPSKQELVLAGLDTLVERIEAASNLEWLPVSVNLELTDAVFRGLGEEQANHFYQSWLKRQMSAPAFAGLVRTALSLFRFDTGAIAKWIPKAFDLMYRDYGSFTIEQVAPQHLHVVLSAMPTELSAHENWQRSVSSGLHALFFLTGVQGTTELTRASGLQRRMQVDLRWTS